MGTRDARWGRRAARRRCVLAGVAVAGLAVMAGCGSSDSGGSAGTATGDGAKKDVTVGFAQANFGNGWYEVQVQGVKDEMAKLGYKVNVVSGGGDAQTQNSQIKNFILQGVDAVIMNPTDPKAVGASIAALKAKKIPLVTVNTPLDPSLASAPYCYVAEDEILNASKVGAEMAKVLKAKYGSDQPLKAVLIGGFPGDLNDVHRQTGFRKGYASVAGAPKLEELKRIYGHWQADQALAPTRSVATANPDLKAVFVMTDSMMPGVETALKAAGLWDKVVIAGYDGRMAILKEMKDNPKGPIITTVPNLPYDQGKLGAQMVGDALKGVPQSQACPGGVKRVGGPVYTTENAGKYYTPDRDY
jgi:ribose transport system substrate-binding protein